MVLGSCRSVNLGAFSINLGNHLETPGEQDGFENLDFQMIWDSVLEPVLEPILEPF